MDKISYVLIGVAAVLLVYALIRGQGLALDGLKLTGITIWKNLPIMLAGFLIAGLIQVLVPKEMIISWFGNQAGAKAVLLGCLAGGLIPGSPYAVLPIVAGLYRAGAGLGAVVGFMAAWQMWSISRLSIEIALVEPKVALLRFGVTFIVPPIAGFLAQFLGQKFPILIP